MRLKKILMSLVSAMFVGMSWINVMPAEAASVDDSSFVLQGMDDDGMVNYSVKVTDDNGKSYAFDYRIRLNSDYGAYKIHGEKKWRYWPEPGMNPNYSDLDKLAANGLRVNRTATTPYESEVEAITQAADVIYTMYFGMSIDEFKSNFSGVVGWTGDRGKPFDVNSVSSNEYGQTYFNLYRNLSNDCIERIFCKFYNGTLVLYSVDFYTNSDQIANKIFTRAVWNYGKLGSGRATDKWTRRWTKEKIVVADNRKVPLWNYKTNKRDIYNHCVIISHNNQI